MQLRQGVDSVGVATPGDRIPPHPSLRSQPDATKAADVSVNSNSVHIGQLEIRIDSPQQRARESVRAPVRLNGSSLISRLYLRKT